jgi:hypothetical protein
LVQPLFIFDSHQPPESSFHPAPFRNPITSIRIKSYAITLNMATKTPDVECHGGLKLQTFGDETFHMVPLSGDSGICIRETDPEKDPENEVTPPRAKFGLSVYNTVRGERVIVPTGFPEYMIFIADNGEAIRLLPLSTAKDVYKSLSLMSKEMKAGIRDMTGELDMERDLFDAAWKKPFGIHFYPADSKKRVPPNTVVEVGIIPFDEKSYTHPAYSLAITSHAEGVRIYDGKTAEKICESLNRLPMEAKERLLGLIDKHGLNPLPDYV